MAISHSAFTLREQREVSCGGGAGQVGEGAAEPRPCPGRSLPGRQATWGSHWAQSEACPGRRGTSEVRAARGRGVGSRAHGQAQSKVPPTPQLREFSFPSQT